MFCQASIHEKKTHCSLKKNHLPTGKHTRFLPPRTLPGGQPSPFGFPRNPPGNHVDPGGLEGDGRRGRRSLAVAALRIRGAAHGALVVPQEGVAP